MAIKTVTMTETQLKELVKTTVNETLLSLGVEYTDPIEMQKDFQHMRKFRVTGETLRDEGRKYFVVIFIAGVASLLYLGFKEQILSFFR